MPSVDAALAPPIRAYVHSNLLRHRGGEPKETQRSAMGSGSNNPGACADSHGTLKHDPAATVNRPAEANHRSPPCLGRRQARQAILAVG